MHGDRRASGTIAVEELAVGAVFVLLSISRSKQGKYLLFLYPFVAAVLALFVLRQREPDAPRPFRAWGYPVAPAIFATASLAIVLNALWVDLVVPMRTGAPWGPAAAGILIIALGIPLYFFFSRRQA